MKTKVHAVIKIWDSVKLKTLQRLNAHPVQTTVKNAVPTIPQPVQVHKLVVDLDGTEREMLQMLRVQHVR